MILLRVRPRLLGAALALLPAASQASAHGHPSASLRLTLRADIGIVVSLAEAAEELEEMVVSSTRTERRIDYEPTRVEVLWREEIEEKMMMRPGDVSMMLNGTSGLRVQVTSPSLGGAHVRVQGLRGRYTQTLSDGLPLYGGQSGALGLLQIPSSTCVRAPTTRWCFRSVPPLGAGRPTRLGAAGGSGRRPGDSGSAFSSVSAGSRWRKVQTEARAGAGTPRLAARGRGE